MFWYARSLHENLLVPVCRCHVLLCKVPDLPITRCRSKIRIRIFSTNGKLLSGTKGSAVSKLERLETPTGLDSVIAKKLSP
jgi:hypothetical protein